MKRIHVVQGDMTAPRCGLTAAQVRALKGKVKHLFHLAAIYDMSASAASQRAANIDGTQHALDLAAAIEVGCFHHTSSIAAAGLYPGIFREDMLEEAEGLDDPCLRTKHDSEGLVRDETRVKWRIYRPGKVVVITGGSSGIGLSTAKCVAEAGAVTVIVARGKDELFKARDEMKAAGGKVFAYTADLSDIADCDRLVAAVLKDHGHVDVLINNAGRSIRRLIELSYDRFHDFERTMQLNYFGSLRLIMGFMPTMTQRRKGHIINISSIGVLANSPRFSAYVASKAALDAFSRCAQGELSGKGISFTTVNMPLVKTPMIAPTRMYDSIPTLTPEEAAELLVKAIIEKPSRIATRLGIFSALVNALAAKAYEVIMNTAFELFPDSAAAKGDAKALKGESQPSNEQIAFATMMRGVHW